MQFLLNLFHCMQNGNYDRVYTYNISIFVGYACVVHMNTIYTHVLISWIYTYLWYIFDWYITCEYIYFGIHHMWLYWFWVYNFWVCLILIIFAGYIFFGYVYYHLRVWLELVYTCIYIPKSKKSDKYKGHIWVYTYMQTRHTLEYIDMQRWSKYDKIK